MFCAQCGTSNNDSDRFCSRCGAAIGQNAMAVTSIQPSAVVMASGGLGVSGAAPVPRCEGSRLIVPRNVTTLPPYCVRCGQPSTNTVTKTFGWHTPWLYLLILFPGLLIYAIVATIVMKKQKLAVPLCDGHRHQRKVWLGIGWVALLGSIPFGVLIGNLGEDTGGLGVLAFFVAFLASLVFFVIGSRLMSPKEIDEQRGVYGGVSPIFLQYVDLQARSTASGS